MNARLGGGHQVHRLVPASTRDHPLMRHLPPATLVTYCGADRKWFWNWLNARSEHCVLREEKQERYLALGLGFKDRGLRQSTVAPTCRVCNGLAAERRKRTRRMEGR